MVLLGGLVVLLFVEVLRKPRNFPAYLMGFGLLLISPSLLSFMQPVGLLLISAGGIFSVVAGSVRLSRTSGRSLGALIAVHAIPMAISFATLNYAGGSYVIIFLLTLAIAILVFPVVSYADYARALTRFLTTAVLLSVASLVVTWVLDRIFRVGPIRMPDAGLSALNETGAVVVFPFTVYRGESSFDFAGGLAIDRWTGLAREPGMSALYCLVALIAIQVLVKGPRAFFASLLLLVGVVGTGSTSGIAIFVAAWSMMLLYRWAGNALSGKWAISLLLLTLPFLFFPSLRSFADQLLGEKQTRDSMSFDARFVDAREGLVSLREAPFTGSDIAGSSFSLIGGISQWGVSYPILVLLFCTTVWMISSRSAELAIGVLAVYVTFLTTQPFLQSFLPLIYLVAVAYALRCANNISQGRSELSSGGPMPTEPHRN